jgi:hypothetical protein
VKPADISGIKRRNIRKAKLMSLNGTVRTRTSETCIEEQINWRNFTNLQII